ncbi:hypothetical protein EON64_00830 [archaeon]|nr:MAG: hypothetical protein EON64_00830 [archaeon]
MDPTIGGNEFDYQRLDTPPTPRQVAQSSDAAFQSVQPESEKLRNRDSLTRRLSSNFKLLEESLQSTYTLDKSSIVHIFEIESGGRSNSREIGIRSLTNYINLIIHMVDRKADTAPMSPLQNKSDKMPSPKEVQNKDDSSLKVTSRSRSPLTSLPSQYNPLYPSISKRHSVYGAPVAPGITIKSDLSTANLQSMDVARPVKQGFDISIHASHGDNKRTVSTDQHSKLSLKLRNHHGSPLSKLRTSIKHSVNSRLSARDMRRLDYLHNPSPDGLLLIREHCILLSAHPIRCVIMADRIIIIAPPSSIAEQQAMFLKVFPSLHTALADYTLRDMNTMLSEDIRGKDEVPFEFHCLEMVLTTVHSMYSGLLSQLYKQVRDTIDTVTRMTEHHELVIAQIIEDLKVLSTGIDKIHSQIHTVHLQLDDVANDDEELALMNLTVLSKKPLLYSLPLKSEILKFHERSEVR